MALALATQCSTLFYCNPGNMKTIEMKSKFSRVILWVSWKNKLNTNGVFNAYLWCILLISVIKPFFRQRPWETFRTLISFEVQIKSCKIQLIIALSQGCVWYQDAFLSYCTIGSGYNAESKVYLNLQPTWQHFFCH